MITYKQKVWIRDRYVDDTIQVRRSPRTDTQTDSQTNPTDRQEVVVIKTG